MNWDVATGKDLTELSELLESARSRKQAAHAAAEWIRQAGAFDWVGIYDVLPEEISAIAWTGEETPAFPRFPRAQGLNGVAVAENATVIANDVENDARYLTTFARTGAEMIVPIRSGSEVVGTLDIESPRSYAFDDKARKFAEGCAELLAPLWAGLNSGGDINAR